MAKFMLLLHDRPKAFAGLSPAEMQQIVLKYVAWGRRLRVKKLMVEGHKLTENPGRVVRQKRGKPMVSDGPYAESKELLGGYYIVKAKDYDEALHLALDCPHVAYGTIEVRQVDEV